MTTAMPAKIVTAVLLLQLAGCGGSSDPKEEVQSVLQQRERMKLPADGTARETTKAIARHLQSIDASRCPEDFRTAWRQYVAAQQQLAAASDSAWGAFFSTIRSGLCDDPLKEPLLKDNAVVKALKKKG